MANKSNPPRGAKKTYKVHEALDAALASVAQLATEIHGEEAVGEETAQKRVEKRTRLDVFLFFSFDLVGSTELKKASLTETTWVEVIRFFYGVCRRLIRDNEINDARVWKLIGDEVVFYLKITDPKQIEKTVRGIYRSVLMFKGYLTDASRIAEANKYVSIKAVAWLAPIKQDVDAASLTEEQHKLYADLFKKYKDDDVQIKTDEDDDNSPVDFLGPNIDAGFRISRFARRLQLVLSPALARYLCVKKQSTDRMRIVGYESLKGVANGKLFPGIWYHENWSKIREDFNYQERHGDELVSKVCSNGCLPITELDEVCELLQEFGYFFGDEIIDEIIKVSGG